MNPLTIIAAIIGAVVVLTFFVLCWTIANIREDVKKIREIAERK